MAASVETVWEKAGAMVASVETVWEEAVAMVASVETVWEEARVMVASVETVWEEVGALTAYLDFLWEEDETLDDFLRFEAELDDVPGNCLQFKLQVRRMLEEIVATEKALLQLREEFSDLGCDAVEWRFLSRALTRVEDEEAAGGVRSRLGKLEDSGNRGGGIFLATHAIFSSVAHSRLTLRLWRWTATDSKRYSGRMW